MSEVESGALVIAAQEDNTQVERSIVLADDKGGKIVLNESQLAAMVSSLGAALDVYYGGNPHRRPEPKNAWECLRENAQLREQNRLLGERFKQQESIIRGAFARALKGVSGITPKVHLEAAQLVAIVNDHYDAETLLKQAGIPYRNVASAVRRLIAGYVAPVEEQPFTTPALPAVKQESQPPLLDEPGGGSYRSSSAPDKLLP